MPANFIVRVKLRDSLVDLGAEFPVTLLCAPAGYGKTLLLADWVERTGAEDKAWVALDASDNDTGRFWTAVLAALRGCASVPATSRLHRLVPPRRQEALGAAEFVSEVIDGLAALHAPLYLVLDDLHEITSTEIWHDLASLVRHQPKQARLILSTRADPPLPIARLRLQGRLGELRAEELRFTHDDAAELVRRADVHLDDDQTRRLVDQTEGWPAGLRLAARSLRDVADHDAFLSAFAGKDRAIADFLVSEVLVRLPADTAEVLKMVSVCDEVTPALAAALTGREDAGSILADLERESSLVLGVGPGRQWFRTHPLLRAYLHAELARQRPDTVTELHGIAATWFADREQADKAFDHIALVQDTQGLVDLLRRHAVSQLLTGDDHRGVRRALTKVGRDAIDRSPWLALISVLAHDVAGPGGACHAEADTELGAIGWPAEPDAELVALRLLVTTTHALIRGRPPDATPADWLGVAAAHEGTDLEAWARLGLGWTRLCTGRRAEARHELTVATRLSREHGLDHITMHSQSALAVLSCSTGAFTAMAASCAEAADIAAAHGWRTSPWSAANHIMAGLARLLRLDPSGTLDELRQAAAALVNAPDPRLSYMIDTLSGAACFDTGRQQDGLWLIRAARHDLGNVRLPAAVVVTGALLEHRSALKLGQDTQAIVDWTRTQVGDVAELSLMHAWTAFACGDPATTDTLLQNILRHVRPSLCPTTALEARLLETALQIRNEQRTKARNSLDAALALAAADNLIRPFHQADASVRQLLVEQAGSFGTTNNFATGVIHALSVIDAPRNDELTNREHTVLVLLSSPQSIDEMATDLSVSVNTVKTHVRAIYSKLGVNSRRAAVVAARQFGID